MCKNTAPTAKEMVDVVLEIIENISRIRETSTDVAQAEAKSREYMAGVLRENGFDVSFDSGNIFATLPGTDTSLPGVALTASFSFALADGKYSVALAVAAAVAVAGSLAKSGEKLAHFVQVIILSDETPKEFKGKIKAFLGLDVERDGYLAREEIDLAIVGTVAMPTKLKITVTTDICERLDKIPVNERQDALVSAAMLVLAVRNIAIQEEENGIIATVESISTPLCSTGTIPALAKMLVDIRGVKHEGIIEVMQEIKDEASVISEEQNSTISIAVLSSKRPVRLDGNIARLMEDTCRQHKISYEHLDSLHEYAVAQMAGVAAGGLALIPCRHKGDNLSEEMVDKKDIEKGVKILRDVLYSLAK